MFHAVGKGRPDRLTSPPGGSERSERGGMFHLQIGVGRVPYPVAHEIERKDRDDDGKGRQKKPVRNSGGGHDMSKSIIQNIR